MKKYQLIKTTVAATLLLTSLPFFTGCTKKAECNIEGKHVHLYINEENFLSKYNESEKIVLNNLKRTSEYLPISKNLEIVVENNLYIVEDNIEYIKEIINNHPKKRQAYVYDYIYGQYYGYGHGFNPLTGDFEYFYGSHTGYHYGYEWQDIPLDEYTSDKVRDVTYKFKFYKINEDGTLYEKEFENLDSVTGEYKYFKTNDFVVESNSDTYYLTKEKNK